MTSSSCEECARLRRRIDELEKEVSLLTCCPELAAVRVSGSVASLREEPSLVVNDASRGSNCVGICLVDDTNFVISGADSSLSLYQGDRLVATEKLDSPAICLRSDGCGRVACATMDGSLRVFSTEQLSPLFRAKDHAKIAVDCDWSPSRKLLATCGRDQTVALYCSRDENLELVRTLHFPNNPECVRFLNDSTLVVSARNEPFLRTVDVETFSETRTSLNASSWDTHNSFDVLHMSIQDNLIALATSQHRHIVVTPESRRGGIARALTGHQSDAYSNTRIAWLDKDSIVSSSSDNSLYQWDFGTGKIIAKIENAHDRPIRNLDALPGMVATTSFDKKAKLWQTTTSTSTTLGA